MMRATICTLMVAVAVAMVLGGCTSTPDGGGCSMCADMMTSGKDGWCASCQQGMAGGEMMKCEGCFKQKTGGPACAKHSAKK